MSVRSILALAAICASAATAAGAITFDFSSSDGGFVGTDAWSYSGSSWQVPGFQEDNTETLDAPVTVVAVDGTVEISISHAYDFEDPSDFFDGGILQLSINGAAFQTLTPTGGYPVAASTADGCDGLGFTPCWGGESGPTTDTFSVAGLSAGDALVVRLLAQWDRSIAVPDPNWTITSLAITNASVPAVPVPGSGALIVGGLMALGFARHRKARSFTR